jgi:hypothetical protein
LFYRVSVMVFNATFNNISVISWQSVLLVEYPEKTTKKLYHIMLYQLHLAWAGFELTTLVVIGTDCIGSSKSNYHTITTTTAPQQEIKDKLHEHIFRTEFRIRHEEFGYLFKTSFKVDIHTIFIERMWTPPYKQCINLQHGIRS